MEICDDLQGFSQIYTDGSKTNNGTAAAAMSGDMVTSLRITSHAIIFTAELVAVNLALDVMRRSRRKIFCHFLLFVFRFGGYSPLPLRGCSTPGKSVICSEIHHKLLPAGQCQKVYYPCLNARSYWYPI